VLDELLRRGRAHGLGVNRMVRVVHHVLLYSVRPAPRGTVVRATPRPVSGHRWSLVECCIAHTLAHGAHPPQAFVEPSAISAMWAWHTPGDALAGLRGLTLPRRVLTKGRVER
jgi:hypothetical protein